MKQYIKNKPTKWGFKCFTLCDSNNAYICRFDLYTGRQDNDGIHGATHQVVMNLIDPYLDQGYHLFTDNFYTSHDLAESLIDRSTALVGTVQSKRRGFPDRLKNVKEMQRYGQRGDMRFEREGNIVYIQWLDKRVVTVLSTIHSANTSVNIHRWVRVAGEYQQQLFVKPAAIDTYNRFMGGVDVFDQLASTYRILRKSKKFTKVIFYDLLGIGTINALKLMCVWMDAHPGVIVRRRSYNQCEFRENLILQLAGIGLHGNPPPAKRRRESSRKVVFTWSIHLSSPRTGPTAPCAGSIDISA